MDETLDFDCYSLGSKNLDNFTPTQSIFVKLSRDVIVNIMINMYIWNGLGRNLENLESCFCLRLLKEAKIRYLSNMAMFKQLNDQLLVRSK
jgi:hypothetical protein